MAIFANDTFTAANGTAINGRTADSGGTWSTTSWGVATGAIQNNRAYGGNTLSAFRLSLSPATANYKVTCDLVYTGLSTVNYVGVMGRTDGSGNGYGLFRDNNDISIYRYDAGVSTALGTVLRTYEDCHLELDLLGTQIRAYVVEAASGNYVTSAGGTSPTRQACISVTDSNHTAAGTPGMYLSNSSSTTRAHLDNFAATQSEIFSRSPSSSISLSQAAVVKAYRRPLYFNGSRIARLPDGEFVSGSPISEFLTVTLTDTSDLTHYYYGGLTESGDWQINRYPKASPTTKNIATEDVNGGYLTLASAWSDRTTLTYV